MVGTQRYKRRDSSGSSFFARKGGIFSLGRAEKKNLLCADVVVVDIPEAFRQESRFRLPVNFRAKLIDDDDAMDRAYGHIRGMDRCRLTEVLEGLVRRIVKDHHDRLVEFQPRQLLVFLDRQLFALGMQILEVHQGV